uniref:Uncharacterized protein n=1 Tax=Amphiprion percula TaxID=161767 RepID=A0A3P8SCN2_AMPPE
MEERPDSPRAVKVEELSQCVILTYFKGDINSMVDAHFSRALNKTFKSKAPAAKVKKIRKTIKLEPTIGSCQGSATESYGESQAPPVPGHLLSFSSSEQTHKLPERPLDHCEQHQTCALWSHQHHIHSSYMVH